VIEWRKLGIVGEKATVPDTSSSEPLGTLSRETRKVVLRSLCEWAVPYLRTEFGKHQQKQEADSGIEKIRRSGNLPRQHTDAWILKQQRLSGKSGKWKTRTDGSPAQIGQRFRKQRRARHVVSPKLKTRSLSHRLVVPDREGVARKPREIKPRKEIKIGKKPKPRTGMTHLEKLHLLTFAKQHELDTQEIDSKIGYYENKQHLEQLAKEKGVSEEEIKGSEAAQEEMVSQHEEYLHHLVSELVESGYKVIGPTD
jgi:hypothetical protein